MTNKIVNVGIRLTRNCNMKCMYCNVQNFERDELSLEKWKQIAIKLKELGARQIVILGGEPTLYNGIVSLVDFIENHLNISCSLTTNAFDNYDIINELLAVGLSFLGVSVDNIDVKMSISPAKAKYGLNLINSIGTLEKTNMINYTVLNKNNVDSILNLIEYMNSKDIYTYILPFHWGNENTFEHRKNNERFAFVSEEDCLNYNNTIDKIIELKRQGYKIKNSFEFLENSKKYIKNLDWKCNGLSELRIDSDGRLVCCCDKFGNVNKHFTIFDLPEKLEEFFIMREEDAKLCKGCLWPSSYESQLKRDTEVY